MGSLGHGQSQNAILILGADILGTDVLAHVEAPAANAGVTLPAEILAVAVSLVLVQTLGRTDGQVAILQVNSNLILLETGQVHIHLIGILQLPDVGLHQILGVFAVQRVIAANRHHHAKGVSKEIIEQVLTKNARQHKSFLHSIFRWRLTECRALAN